ncbi:MAG: hypothetical protein ABR597_09245 [Bacteroidales bacterium]
MNGFTTDKFKELAQINEPHSISIYIPTHRAGKEVNEKVDQINLKNQVQKVAKELESWQLDNRQIDDLLDPVNKLVNDTGFWNNQSDGLAIFRNMNRFEYYSVPVVFEEFTYVSDHFYLKPMISYLNDDGKYFLLALSLSGVKFFEGFPHQINEVEVHDLLPEQLEDAVGYDFKEKHLQFRSGQTPSNANEGMYHGHGKGNEEEKPEILKYFRAINNGLMEMIKNKNRPLVIACVDYLFPLYKEVNEYQNLWEEFIAGNPEHEDPVLLHEKTRELLSKYFTRDREKVRNTFEHALSNNLASYNEEEIVPAAFNKRVETLLVKNRENMWGMFDKESNTIKPREQQTQFKSCMLNFAAVHTMLNGGKVYLMESDEMPESTSKLNAIFRF